MNKTTIISLASVIFLTLILGTFLSVIKTNDDGYNTKKEAAMPALQAEGESLTDTAVVMAEDVMESVVEVTETVEEAVSSVVEEQAASVAMIEEKVDEAIEPVASAVNDVVSEAKSTVEEVMEAVAPATPATDSATAAGGLYSVVDGNKLDAHSYAGFKLYRNWCARCHGTYGQGMVGPNLADSLKVISKEDFYNTVENGKTGTIGSMPAWKANVQVMENRDQLYAYLKARSDGAIGEEKPKKQ